MDIFEQLRNLDQPVPIPLSLPTLVQVTEIETELGTQFPPSYKKFQLGYSDVNLPPYELFNCLKEGDYLDILENYKEAGEYYQLPVNLIPFAADNGNYFCFDINSAGPEYKVVYFDHNGSSTESWSNFLEWVEKCWIEESRE